MALKDIPLCQEKTLLKSNYLCIEYPGYVGNIEKVLETLGGEEGIRDIGSNLTNLFNCWTRKAYRNKLKQLPLSFRPCDSFSHPIFLDRVNTSHMLLEIELKTDLENNTYLVDSEIVGIIPFMYQYQGMADFQYLPRKMSDPSVQPDEDQLLLEDEDQMEAHVPPPIFSKSDIAQSYQFEANPHYKLVQVRDKEGNNKKILVSKKSRHLTDGAPMIHFDDPNIPTHPHSNNRGIHQELVDTMKLMFQDHPIWSRAALENNLPRHLSSYFTPSLYHVSYTFSNGPWRHTWIRMGYDPRLDPNARRYQVIDLRVNEQLTRPSESISQHLSIDSGMTVDLSKYKSYKPRRKDLPRDHWHQMLDQAQLSEDQCRLASHLREAEYKFLKPPSHRQAIYMFNDIEMEGLEEELSKVGEKCRKDTGWIMPSTMREIRKRMIEKMAILIHQWDRGDIPIDLNEVESDIIIRQLQQVEEDEDKKENQGEEIEFPEFGNGRDRSNNQIQSRDEMKELSQENQSVYQFLGDIFNSVQNASDLSQVADHLDQLQDTYDIFEESEHE